MLDQFLDPVSRCLDAESARRVLALGVSAPVQARIDTLAERANEGLLSEDERAEYEALINAEDFVAILKLKAAGSFPKLCRWKQRRGYLSEPGFGIVVNIVCFLRTSVPLGFTSSTSCLASMAGLTMIAIWPLRVTAATFARART